ncbi:MAG: N-acetylmuramoyl-L-alanine amidase [Elusimicrobiaceae bacterium]|nr:N-acetylmuramoyl-L-alanine amidase [Elusimicrobiaceae bacterium]
MKKIPFLLISALCCAFYVGAETIPVAPFLPAQEQSAPKDAPITVQYPYEKMTVSRGAKEIFLSGQVNIPAPFTLEINGQEVPVHHNGAFVAFLPIQNGDFQFLLTAKTSEDTYQAVRNITVPGTAIKDFSAKAQFDKEEIFPQHPVEVLPGDTLDLYARGTPDAQVTATLSGIKDAKDIPLTQSTVSPGIYRAHYTLSADQKAKNIKVTYRMKQGPKDSSAKISAPEKIKILGPKEMLRTARITSPGVKLRKIPTPRENLYPFYRAYGQVYVIGRRNSQYRIRLNENETAWLEMDKLQLIRTSEKDLPIRELTQTTLEDKTRLVFQLGKEVPISVHEFSNRLELAFYYTEGFEENFSLDVSDPLVDQVVWSQPAQNTVLFKIYFKPDTQLWGHAYNFENGNLVLDLIHRPQLTPTKEKPLAGARILLDAGHSPKRTVPYDGAIGPTGYLEYEATLALAEELKPLLEKQGATVLLTRQGNNHMTLQDRYQYALKEQAHIFISLHYNALPETANPRAQARGYSVYYNYPHSVKLAEAIYRSFTRQVPLPDNGMIADDILFIPRIPHLPSILVENAYLILPEQEEMAKDPLIRHQFVQALYEGILDFYGIAPAVKPKKQPAKRQPFQKPLKQTYLRAAKPPVLLPGKK